MLYSTILTAVLAAIAAAAPVAQRGFAGRVGTVQPGKDFAENKARQ